MDPDQPAAEPGVPAAPPAGPAADAAPAGVAVVAADSPPEPASPASSEGASSASTSPASSEEAAIERGGEIAIVTVDPAIVEPLTLELTEERDLQDLLVAAQASFQAQASEQAARQAQQLAAMQQQLDRQAATHAEQLAAAAPPATLTTSATPSPEPAPVESGPDHPRAFTLNEANEFQAAIHATQASFQAMMAEQAAQQAQAHHEQLAAMQQQLEQQAAVHSGQLATAAFEVAGLTEQLAAAAHAPANSRLSVLIADADFDPREVEKQLHRFVNADVGKFKGAPTEDIDGVLEAFERRLRLIDPKLWVLFLDHHCLCGSASTQFAQRFPNPLSVTWEAATTYLRDRYRGLRHTLDTVTNILSATQTSTVTALFEYLEKQVTRLRQAGGTAGANVVSDSVLVAVVVRAVRGHIARRLRSDPTKLRSNYSLQQLKDDCLSIEAAHVGNGGGGGGGGGGTDGTVGHDDGFSSGGRPSRRERDQRKKARAAAAEAHLATADPEYEAYVISREQNAGLNRAEIGPRPAYQHAAWYVRDGNSCRYCKSVGHNTAVCDVLYKTINKGSTMPDELIKKNQAVIDAV